MKPYCPISHSHNVVLLDKIQSKELAQLYRRVLNIDVELEFSQISELGLYYCPDSDLKFFYPPVTGSEFFYEKLQAFPWYYTNYRYEYDYTKQFLRESDSILEIGCGKGVFAEQASVEHYIGLEYNQKAIELASSRSITVLNESVQTHAVNNSLKYDVVCAFQVLEHVADILSFITASIDCLKPGGFIIYSVPSSDSFLSVAVNNILNMPPHHVSCWSDKCLRFIGHKFGLEIIDIKHEKLAEEHKNWYLSTVIMESLRQRFGLKHSLIERSLKHKLLATIAAFGGSFLVEGLKNPNLLPNGHSAIAVYQKPKGEPFERFTP
ncbi:MAG: methyltransferase domain-containing protein [Stenomitos rutilans HA7619-LM2]|jgi:2-polyprenyl-3-methyl-5-hydroxy-6-metoxy-1,4-benzoquinol methylase|nr:methyltransferase domain-containing protein [Stenomitos rutilans HA7619-LM2]